MVDINQNKDRVDILTVALEDYFQVASFHRLIDSGQWYRFERRLERNTAATLDLLRRFNVKATFFVLGWVADKLPELVRSVFAEGHEIADKGYFHRNIQQMTPDEFREDLLRSREAIERATGVPVQGYRVADGWFRPEDLWALDTLADLGYRYDSSICPIFRRFAHEPWRRFVHRHESAGRTLWEFPPSTTHFLGLDLPIAGGNYFRQLPRPFIHGAVEDWHRRRSEPFVMYFHVWEMDRDQPRINAPSLWEQVRHYRNLGTMDRILEPFLEAYKFTSVADHLGLEKSPLEKALECVRPRSPVAETGGGRGTAGDPAERTPITIVIPCYNEELIIPYLANTLESVLNKFQARYESRLIFVDDGSKDGTWKALWKTFGAMPNARVLRHDRNRGVAAAVLTGVHAAETSIVCTMDCDCSYDPHDLGVMVPLLTRDVDLVTASPYHPQGEVRNVPAWRLGLSRSASFLYRRVLHNKIHTYTSCFRVYRREAVLEVQCRNDGFLGIAEVLGLIDLRGGNIVEVPATLQVRVLGRSKMKTLRTIVGHLGLLGRLVAMRRSASRLAKRPALIESPPQSGPTGGPSGTPTTRRSA